MSTQHNASAYHEEATAAPGANLLLSLSNLFILFADSDNWSFLLSSGGGEGTLQLDLLVVTKLLLCGEGGGKRGEGGRLWPSVYHPTMGKGEANASQ